MSGIRIDPEGGSGLATARYGIVLVVGVLASSIHWFGLLLGGVLLGVLAPTTRRGVAYGAAFGLLVWALFVGRMVMNGVIPTMDSAQLFVTSVAISVLLGAVGGTAAELRPWVERARSRLRT